MKKTYLICLTLILCLLILAGSGAAEAPSISVVDVQTIDVQPTESTSNVVTEPISALGTIAPTLATDPLLTESGEPQVRYVLNPNTTDRLNLRSEPSLTSDVLGRYYTATVVEVMGPSSEFTQVRVGDLVGYMQTSFLAETRTDLPSSAWAVVSLPKADETVNLRASTEEGALSYARFPSGTTVQILEDAGTHYKVRTTVSEGYISKDFLSVDGSAQKPIMTVLSEGQITEGQTTLYAFPSREGVSMGVCQSGDIVKILSVCGTWYYVEVSGPNGWAAENQRGFISALTMQVSNHGSAGAGAQTFAIVHSSNETDQFLLRSAATWNSESLGMFCNAAQMVVLDSVSIEGPKPTWVHVQMGTAEGYIQGEFIEWVSSEAFTQ